MNWQTLQNNDIFSKLCSKTVGKSGSLTAHCLVKDELTDIIKQLTAQRNK